MYEKMLVCRILFEEIDTGCSECDLKNLENFIDCSTMDLTTILLVF